MKRIIFITLLLILFVSAAQAQTAENWTRLESDAKDFSVAVPQNYQAIFDENDLETYYGAPNKARKFKLSDMRFVTAFQSGATFLVASYKTNNLSAALAFLNPGASRVSEYTDFNFNGFEGKMLTRQDENSYALEILIAHKNYVYRIFGGARDKNSEALKYFFSSVRLNDKHPFALNSALENKVSETSLLISNLKETPFTFEKEKEEKPQKTDKNNQVETKKEENKKGLVILYNLQPGYTEAARQTMTRGKVRLKVTFAENGNIEKVSVLDGLSNGLTETSVKAARLIRFLPVEVDNKQVTTTKTVEFSFSIY